MISIEQLSKICRKNPEHCLELSDEQLVDLYFLGEINHCYSDDPDSTNEWLGEMIEEDRLADFMTQQYKLLRVKDEYN